MRAMSSLLVAALLGALAAPAAAKDPKDPKAAIERYTEAAQAFDARDARKQVSNEIGTLRAWLGEARAYLKTGDDEELAATLQRASVMVRLIDALQRRSEAETKAREAHAAADEKERAAATARNTAYELEQQLAAMEQQGRKPK